MSEIRIIVEGPVGCGKSAIAGEIEIAMRAIGVPVRFADEKEMRSEKNMTHADWTGYLEMYQPSVVIEERIAATAPRSGESK
jgi:MoxR-like ATPase